MDRRVYLIRWNRSGRLIRESPRDRKCTIDDALHVASAWFERSEAGDVVGLYEQDHNGDYRLQSEWRRG